jgi:hypothetical protein
MAVTELRTPLEAVRAVAQTYGAAFKCDVKIVKCDRPTDRDGTHIDCFKVCMVGIRDPNTGRDFLVHVTWFATNVWPPPWSPPSIPDPTDITNEKTIVETDVDKRARVARVLAWCAGSGVCR